MSDTELLALGFVGSSRAAFTIYDIQTGKLDREIVCPDLCSATFKARLSEDVTLTSSRKYAVLAAEYPTSRLLLFNMKSEEFVGELAGGSYALLATIAAGPGDMLATSTAYPPYPEVRKEIYLVDAKANEVNRILQGHIPNVSSLAWSPNGRLLASGASGFRGERDDGAGKPKWIRDVDPVRVWNTETGEMVVSFSGEAEPIKFLTWHPSGRVFAAVGSRGDGGVGSALRLWSVPDQKMIFEYFMPHPSFLFRYLTGGNTTALSFHPATGQLVMGFNDGLEIFEVIGLT